MNYDMIGKYSIIESKRFIVPENCDEDILVNTKYEDEEINFVIRFATDLDSNGAKLRINGEDERAIVTLINWKSTLGSATQETIKIGSTEKHEPVHIMLASWLLGKARIVELQVMIERAK